MHRIYNTVIENHLKRNRQMCFLSGPRQVGKTTLSSLLSEPVNYFNWDIQDDRQSIIHGPAGIAQRTGEIPGLWLFFDEIHKYPGWKNFLKGLFDKYSPLKWKIIATGSSHLDIYRKGGDSLMGRYFHYTVFPFSVGELADSHDIENMLRPAKKVDSLTWETLEKFGGFPEPFIKQDEKFHKQWSRSRYQQLIYEDLRDLGGAYEVSKIGVLAEMITLNATTQLNYSSYSSHLQAAISTIQRWIILLSQLSFCFLLRPWSKNISRSLIKEPKIYLTDWSQITDTGKRAENMIACMLYKTVTAWNECGFGEVGLNYVRTKDKREVDFLVTKDNKPWMLLEVKNSEKQLNPQLEYFQEILGSPYAFQIDCSLPFQNLDFFDIKKPAIISAQNFLSCLW